MRRWHGFEELNFTEQQVVSLEFTAVYSFAARDFLSLAEDGSADEKSRGMGGEYRKLVLASASPRRAELLRRAGLEFEVAPSRIEEHEVPHLSPAELSLWLAKQKAEDVARQRPDAVVLGADTVVALGEQIFGKPGSLIEAAGMLKALSGRSHRVHTGVWIVRAKCGLRRGFVETSEVIFHRLSQARIARYLSEVNPLDKAGGYAAQQNGQRIIQEIRGSWTNVVGLPMEKTLEMLREVIWQQEK